jgi:signal transduction histidine kinase/DNA-binding response OmpR family regulator/ligand-binding sensor domain-containing protein
MKKSSIFLIVCVLLSVNGIFPNKNVIVKEYAVENGLPHNIVYCSIKDTDGLMWFGTWYGLSSFDGVKFRSYNNREDFNSDIPPHKIQKILESPDGNLWVKTIDHKLYLFEKKTELFYDVFNEIKKKYSVSPKIIKIQKNNDGSLLLLTRDKDLLKAKSIGNGKIDVELLYDSETKRDHRITSNLLVENQNYLSWIGVDFKIISVRKSKTLKNKPTDFITRKIGESANQTYTCAELSGRFLWIGSANGVIYKIDTTTGNVKKITAFENSGPVQNICGLNNQTTFVSIGGKGIFELNDQNLTVIKVAGTSGAQTVTNSFIDSYDKIWFELNQNQALYYDPVNKTAKQITLASGKVNRTLQFADGKELGMFIVTTSGDVAWINRTDNELTYLNDLPTMKQGGDKKFFFEVFLDKDNILWMSSTTAGVIRASLPKQQFNLIQIGQSQSVSGNRAIKSLYQARNGDIWAASRMPEVYHMGENGNIKETYSSGSNYIGNVYHIMEDRSGNIWFSTKGDGLVIAEVNPDQPGKYTLKRYTYNETDPNSISGNDVYYTYEDSKGRVWVALFGGGLNLATRKNGQMSFLNSYNSFANYPKYGQYMEVRNITEDREGRFWVGTSDGLMSFDGNFSQPSKIKFEIFRNEKANSNISDNDIYFLFKDASQQIWVSVFGGGLNKLLQYDRKTKRPVFKSYSQKEGLVSEVFVSIVEDDNHALWLATENSISRFDTKKETFRNFDKYDGFMNSQMEEDCALKLKSGELWFGNRNGIIAFNPKNIETYNCDYKTFIVDFLISNRSLRSFKDDPILKESIRYAKSITLNYNQSNFVLEFAALNYYNQNRVSYKYILEGYEDEWHYNGKNRIASYPNVPPGKYTFRVVSIDEANESLRSERTLQIIVLPPWWRTWWAHTIYFILALLLIYFAVKAVFFYIRMRNEVYIEQRVSELKIRFFTNISHELRTPLTLIMGPIQELKQKYTLNEKGQQYLTMIEKSANQMLHLVNQILDFRKIQNGKMILNVSPVNLNTLVESFQKEFMVISEENEISFSFQLADEDIMVWIDKEKIETVIRNVLSNAFKFTRAGGNIFVSTALSEDKKRCLIKIEDTGIGIQANKLNEIFERFSQADHPKNAYYQGTGIGLALSKELINLHHGDILADSKPGVGSVFTIELRMGKDHFKPSEVNFYVDDNVGNATSTTEEVAEKQEEAAEELMNNHLPVLLVVEDNKDLCELLKLQLEDRYNVLTANNGAEGLKKINHYHPDIVVTDQMMPEMTGTEMLKCIREDFKISHIPVIILTAKGSEESKIKAINMGANAYITKPFNKDYLIARIEQLLSDRKVFREKIWHQEEISEDTESDNYENYLVKKDIQLLEKINTVIEENLQNSDFNIDAIAETLGLSRSAFFKKLKSLTGLAPVDLIKEIRLNKSIELLKNTDMTVSEIAFEVGFKEAGYYGKCFRKKYNQTPTEFMSKYRKGQ